MVYNGLRDYVICHIKNSDRIIAAVYIPLSNKYFDDIYFTNLEIIYNKFKSCQLTIMIIDNKQNIIVSGIIQKTLIKV